MQHIGIEGADGEQNPIRVGRQREGNDPGSPHLGGDLPGDLFFDRIPGWDALVHDDPDHVRTESVDFACVVRGGQAVDLHQHTPMLTPATAGVERVSPNAYLGGMMRDPHS